MRQIFLLPFLIITINIYSSGIPETTDNKLVNVDNEVTVSYKTRRLPFNISDEKLEEAIFNLKYSKTIEDWVGVRDACKDIVKMDFFTIKSEDKKAIYLTVLINSLLANIELEDRDIKEFKEGYLYLKEISKTYEPAKDFITLFTAEYDKLVAPNEPWIVSYSRENINSKTNDIKELPNGSGFVTVGNDKTVKIWNSDFSIKKQIRIPSGMGREGSLYSVAVHPTKSIIACAGNTGWQWEGKAYIYYINYQTGELIKRIPVFGGSPTALEFSNDGEYLVQGNSVFGLFSIYSTLDWSEIRSNVDSDLDKLAGVKILKIETLDNSFIILYSNGLLKKFDYYMNQIIEKKFISENNIFDISLNPDSDKIALALGKNKTAILDSMNFNVINYLYKSNNIKNIKWAEDGAIYGTGDIYSLDDNKSRNYGIFYWQDPLKQKYSFIPIGDSDSKIFEPLKNGNTIYISENLSQGIISDGKSTEVRKTDRVVFNNRSGDKIIFVKPRGNHFAYKDNNGDLYEFDLLERRFGEVDKFTAFNPTHKMYSNSITIGPKPTINGEELSSSSDVKNAISGSLIFKEEKVVWSNSSGIYLTDFKGNTIWKQSNLNSTCMALFASYDGRFIIAAFNDGSFKWLNQETGLLEFTLFIDQNREEWLIYTPDGYYDTSSITGSNMAIWHKNRGSDRTAELNYLHQYSKNYYRPDIINSILTRDMGSSSRSYKEVDLSAPSFFDFYINGYPVEPGEYNIDTKTIVKKIELSFKIDSPTPDISGFRLFHNGRNIPMEILLKEKKVKIIPLGNKKYNVEINFKQSAQNNRYKIYYVDIKGIRSKERLVNLYSSEKKQIKKPKGRLHTLLIGVSDYKEESIRDLKYPKNDVITLRDFFLNEGELYPKSDLVALNKELLNRNVTRKDIYSSLFNIKQKIKSADRVFIYLSGNVKKINREYYFLTSNTDPSDKDSLQMSAIKFSEIKELILGMSKASDITFFIDCSYKGSINSRELGYFMKDSGANIILSSKYNQIPVESLDTYNSIFVSSIIEGNRDINSDGYIDINEFIYNVKTNMEKISESRQTLWLPNYKELLNSDVFIFKTKH